MPLYTDGCIYITAALGQSPKSWTPRSNSLRVLNREGRSGLPAGAPWLAAPQVMCKCQTPVPLVTQSLTNPYAASEFVDVKSH